MSQQIRSFKIEPYSLEVETEGKNGRTTHRFYSPCTKAIKKVINSSKAPTLKDVEDWVEAEHAAYKAKTGDACCVGCSFWSND